MDQMRTNRNGGKRRGTYSTDVQARLLLACVLYKVLSIVLNYGIASWFEFETSKSYLSTKQTGLKASLLLQVIDVSHLGKDLSLIQLLVFS